MGDSEASDDGIAELQELIDEYEAKATDKDQKLTNEGTDEQEAEIANPAPKKKSLSLGVEGVPMDKVIFGDKKGLLKNLAKAVGEPNEVVKDETQSEDSESEANETAKTKRKTKKRKPVWVDSDDEQIQFGEIKRANKYTGPLNHLRQDKSYKEYLTSRFTRINSQPKWASLDRQPTAADADNSDDEELLHTVGFLAKPSANTLRQHDIDCKRMKDLNRATYAEGVINSVQFHPSSTAALVAGTTGIATIYAIDGRENEKLHSIRFADFPIKCAKIKPCGTKAIFGSIKPYYYSYDLLKAQEIRCRLPRFIKYVNKFQISPCGRYMASAGRFGELYLFEVASNELIHTFQQENRVASICFTADSRRIICNSQGANVSIFSVREQRLEHTFFDEGCIVGNALDLAPNQRLLATGSNEGVVNVYDFDKVISNRTPLPEKTFLNLTTAISDVKFNHSSELLAMCSNEVRSAVKLAHFPSATIFANFPHFNSGLQKIRTVEFSPGSGYMALGSHLNEVSLFRIKHFKNY